MFCVGTAVVGVRAGEDTTLQDVAAVAADAMVDMEELVSFLARGECPRLSTIPLVAIGTCKTPEPVSSGCLS